MQRGLSYPIGNSTLLRDGEKNSTRPSCASLIKRTTMTSFATYFTHIIDNTLALDEDDKKYIAKKGLKRYIHLLQFGNNMELFNVKFSENTPTVCTIRFNIMYLYVNDCRSNHADVLNHTEETSVDIDKLIETYWRKWNAAHNITPATSSNTTPNSLHPPTASSPAPPSASPTLLSQCLQNLIELPLELP